MKNESAYSDRLIEWQFAVMMAAWGFYLLLPMRTFDNPQYGVLATIAPEEIWGLFAIAIAAVRATAVYINGSWRRTPAIRCACSVLGVIWWLSMTFLVLAASQPHPPPAGVIWYPVFVVFEVISCWRSAADAFHSKAFRLKAGGGRA
ncbi:hypothetical protein [Lichenihabitans psoromatis]|uniref:hypothetical protein n=1 Tax=Lichenihabitans psoromatis TaxID=2528642 RepID=UPI00103843B2|nr:hypothetical protein [Lichenihabitans psoromatis]